MEVSQWVYDTFSLLLGILVFFPFLALLVLFCINVIYCEFKSMNLENDYLDTLTNEERELIRQYKLHRSYYRYSREQRKNEKKK